MEKPQNISYNINEDNMKILISTLKQKKQIIELGRGVENIEKQHKKGKMTARERLTALFDKDSKLIEIGSFAANDLYDEYGGCPCAGVIVMIGEINERNCIVVANDSTVKSGAWFPMTAKKNLETRNINKYKYTNHLFS